MYPATVKLIDVSYIEALKSNFTFPPAFIQGLKRTMFILLSRSAWHTPVSVYRIKGPMAKF